MEYPHWNIQLLEEDVLNNSIISSHADFVVSAFGLKTFSTAQLEKLAFEINRILKPNGQFAFIEISEPKWLLLRLLFMFYLNWIIPIIGKLFMGNSMDYKMLGVYCSKFKNCEKFSTQLKANGLEVRYKKYFFGCATGVMGYKK